MKRTLPLGLSIAVVLLATLGYAAEPARQFTPENSVPKTVTSQQAAAPAEGQATYTGTLRLYLVEPVGRWIDDNHGLYHQGFLDFPLVEPLNLADGATIYRAATWDAATTPMGFITEQNIQVIAVAFNSMPHYKDAYPPYGFYFYAHYVDAAAFATPGVPGTSEIDVPGYTHRVFVEEGTRTS